MQVGTYPTRNFATLGPFNVVALVDFHLQGLGHFCQALQVALQFGLYHLNQVDLSLACSL